MSNVYLDFKNSGDEGHRIYNNLIRHLKDLLGGYGLANESIKEYVLENYNGVYVVVVNKSNHLLKHYIRFSDPKDMTLFVLRFS